MKRRIRENDFEAVLSLFPMQAQTTSNGSCTVNTPEKADWQLTLSLGNGPFVGHNLSHPVVRGPCELDRQVPSEVLDARRRERQDLYVDCCLVHVRDATGAKIQQALASFTADGRVWIKRLPFLRISGSRK